MAVEVKPSFGMRATVEQTVETGFVAAIRDAAEQAMATAWWLWQSRSTRDHAKERHD